MTRALHLRVGAFDLLLAIAAVSGWVTLGTIDIRLLIAAALLRGVLAQVHLWRVLAPVRTWLARGAGASDAELLAADAALQTELLRFIATYAIVWGLAPFAAFALTAATPSLGLIPARAEYLSATVGIFATGSLGYAYMLALGVSVAGELSHALALALRERGVRVARRPRTFARILRRFSIAFTVGMLMATFTLGSKAKLDGQRDRAIAQQIVAATQAAETLARTGRLEASDGALTLERLGSDSLPPLLRPAPGESHVGAFDPRRERIVAAVAIGEDRWLVVDGPFDEQLSVYAVMIATLTLCLGIAAGFAASGMSRLVTRPLGDLRAVARRMVEVGDLRVLERPVASHNDEVGNLTDDLNHMLDALEQLAEAANSVAAGTLTVALDQPGDLHDAFRTMLRQLARIVARLRETALELSSASTELHASMQARERGAIAMTADVERSATKVGSLAESAQQISDAAHEVLTFAEQSLVNVDAVAETSAALHAETAGLRELLERIREIADRSDLLALNGALEATRAGEGGRGFGLVAAEMRRLAERVTLTVGEMRTRISDIEAAGLATMNATDQSRALAKATANAAREIATLTRTQTEDTREVSATTADMAQFVREGSEALSQISATAKGLREHVDELEQLTGRFEL